MEEYNCVICDKKTISPRAHITTHTIDEIIDAFTRLTIDVEKKSYESSNQEAVNSTDSGNSSNQGKKKHDLTQWNLKV